MDTLSKYVQEKDETNNNSVWYALGLGVIISIIILIIIYLVKKKGNKPGFGYVPDKYRKK